MLDPDFKAKAITVEELIDKLNSLPEDCRNKKVVFYTAEDNGSMDDLFFPIVDVDADPYFPTIVYLQTYKETFQLGEP